MSEDEVMATVFCVLASLFTWLWWYGSIVFCRPAPLAKGRPPLLLSALAPLTALLLLLVVLKLWASHDVRDAPQYLFMYAAMGCAWSGVAVLMSPLLGFSLRGDVLRYRNRAAAIALSGWWVGVMLAFAGGNIGDGPHFSVVMLCGLLATGSLLAIVKLFQALAASHDAVTIDHDAAAAIRLAALMVGCGAILGSAVAGDWVSVEATLADFALRGWPALVVLAMAVVLEKMFRANRETPRPSTLMAGAVPALIVLVMSAAPVAFVAGRLMGWMP